MRSRKEIIATGRERGEERFKLTEFTFLNNIIPSTLTGKCPASPAL
jgi:hypothetical protein